MNEGSLLDLDYFLGQTIDSFSHLSDQIFWDFEYEEGRLHVFPSYVKVYVLDGHVLVERYHVWAFVVVGPSKK